MIGRGKSADKARRAIPTTTLETRNPAGESRFRKLIQRGATAAIVSGFAVAGFSAFTAATAGSAGVALADQGLAISSIPAVQAVSDTDSQSIEELAEARAAQLAAASDAIEQSRQDAAAAARSAALSTDAKGVNKEIERLKTLAKFMWPTAGSISPNNDYGMRMHPIYKYMKMHDGDDIGGKCGQPIWAAQSGVVTKVATGYNGGSGNNVWIDHGDINGVDVASGYLHMERYVVSVGQKVNKGDVIGYVGNTGASTACHLHFSIRKNGASSDPIEYIGWNKESKARES